MTDLPISLTPPVLPILPDPADPAEAPAEIIVPPAPGENAPALCGDENAIIPAAEALAAIPGTALPAFSVPFAGGTHASRLELANAMIDAWDEARHALITGALAVALDACDLLAAAICRDQTANIASGRFTADRAVLEAVRRLSGLPLVVWCGRRYAGASDLGGSLLQALRGTGVIPHHLDSLLLSGAASVFCDPAQAGGIAAIEARYAAPDCQPRERTLLMYIVGFFLSGVPAFILEGETFYAVEELAAWLEGRARRSSAAFTRACHRLLDENHLLDPQLEAWLYALGRHQDVQKWQEEIDAGML